MGKYNGIRVDFTGKMNKDGDVAFVEDVNAWLKEQAASPQAGREAVVTLNSLLNAIGVLVEGWEAQGGYLNNPHDHAGDRAGGRVYQECAKLLKAITSSI